MKNTFFYSIILIGSLVGCSSPVDEQPENSDGNEDVIEINSNLSPSSKLHTLNGQVRVSPNAHVSTHVPINSYVTEILVKPGDRVSNGQVVAYIEHPDILKLQEDYLTSKSNFEIEKENYKRKQELFETKAISRKEFLEAEKAYASAKAHTERLTAELEFTGISIKSTEQQIIRRIPIRSTVQGVIATIEANKGKFLSASDALMEIIDDREKWIVFQVYPEQLENIHVGDTLHFTTTQTEGKTVVRSVGGAISDISRGIEVITVPVDHKTLNIGEMVTASFTTK